VRRPYIGRFEASSEGELFAKYAAVVHRAFFELTQAYPGVEIHLNFAVIVPSAEFRTKLVAALKHDRDVLRSEYCVDRKVQVFQPGFLCPPNACCGVRWHGMVLGLPLPTSAHVDKCLL